MENKIVSMGDITVPAHDPKEQRLPKFSLEQLIGQTFLYDTTGGQRVRSEVIRKLATLDTTNHQNIKFKVKTGDVEEVMLLKSRFKTKLIILTSTGRTKVYWNMKGH